MTREDVGWGVATVLAVLLCLGLNLHAGPAWADAAQLTDLGTWARTSAPSVRLAQAEKDVAAHRADAARARQGSPDVSGCG